MTITKTNNAEGGTSGTNVTTSNSGGASGSAWNVIGYSPGSVTYDTASAVHGSLGCKFSPASGSICILRWTGFNDTTGVVRFYITPGTVSSGLESIFAAFTSTGGRVITIAVNASGQYVIQDATNASLTHTTNTAQASDRLELSWAVGTTTGNGSWNFALYRGDSATATETLSGATNNLGTTNWDRAQFGKSTTSTWTAVTTMDDFAAASGTTTFFGPVSTAPTASFTKTLTDPSLAVDGTGSTAVSPATISSYDWDWGDGSTHGSGSTASHTYTANGTYTVVLTVTDSNSLTGSTSQSVTISSVGATIVTKTNNAEGGGDGVTVSLANSGGASGTAWDVINAVGGTMEFSAAAKSHGSLGYLVTPASGGLGLFRWVGFNALSGVARTYYTCVNLPASGGESVLSFFTSTGTALINVEINSSGNYILYTPPNGNIWVSTNTAQAGDRIEFSFTVGTTTSNGSYNLAIYRGDATTPIETTSSTTANLGTTNWDRVQFGKTSTSTWTGTYYFDDMAASSGTTTFFGPATAAPSTLGSFVWNGTSWVQATPYLWNGTAWVPCGVAS